MGQANVGDKQRLEGAFIFADALRAEVKRIVIEAMHEVLSKMSDAVATELLTPEQLAARLQVPVSWVYEQSRHNNIPTHRIGRYVRFDIREVLQYLAEAARTHSSIRRGADDGVR